MSTKARIPQFVAKLHNAPDLAAVERAITAEKRYLAKAYPPANSRRSVMRDYRNEVRRDKSIPLAYRQLVCTKGKAGLTIPIKLRNAALAADSAGVSDRLRGLKPLDNIDALIAQWVRMAESETVSHVILGLAGLTGRRVAEIGVSARFEVVNEAAVWFSGQMKERGEKANALRREGYEIPTLADAHLIADRLAWLRKQRPQWAAPARISDDRLADLAKVFHNAASKTISGAVKSQFGKEWKPKYLRPAYAEIVVATEDDETCAKSLRMSELLGHSTDDWRTGLRYCVFQITDPKYASGWREFVVPEETGTV
jgi:hypothetical protein